MSDAAITRALEIADTRYPNDPVITAIAKKLRIHRTLAEAEARDHATSLAGYRKGMAGKDGYGQLQEFDLGLIGGVMREASRLYEVAVVTEVLVIALRALGEEIDD